MTDPLEVRTLVNGLTDEIALMEELIAELEEAYRTDTPAPETIRLLEEVNARIEYIKERGHAAGLPKAGTPRRV